MIKLVSWWRKLEPVLTESIKLFEELTTVTNSGRLWRWRYQPRLAEKQTHCAPTSSSSLHVGPDFTVRASCDLVLTPFSHTCSSSRCKQKWRWWWSQPALTWWWWGSGSSLQFQEKKKIEKIKSGSNLMMNSNFWWHINCQKYSWDCLSQGQWLFYNI